MSFTRRRLARGRRAATVSRATGCLDATAASRTANARFAHRRIRAGAGQLLAVAASHVLAADVAAALLDWLWQCLATTGKAQISPVKFKTGDICMLKKAILNWKKKREKISGLDQIKLF